MSKGELAGNISINEASSTPSVKESSTPSNQTTESVPKGRLITRRGFLRGALGLAGGLAGGIIASRAESKPTPPSPTIKPTEVVKKEPQVVLEPVPTVIPAQKEVKANLVEAQGPFGPDLEVTEEFFRANPNMIRAFTDVKDVNGNITSKITIADHGQYVSGHWNPKNIFYESTRNPSNGNYSEYKVLSQLPIENPATIVTVNNGNTIIVAGEKTWRYGDTAVIISTDKGKTWAEIQWPYGTAGTTFDLKVIQEDANGIVIYGNNGNYEGGVGQYLIYLDPSTGNTRVQAVTERVESINLPSAGAPEITAQNTSLKEIQVTSVASERLEMGIDVATINYETAQGSSENFFPEIGYVYGKTQWKDSTGKHMMVTDPIEAITFELGLDENNKPTRISNQYSHADWGDNAGITNYEKGSFHIVDFDSKVDSQGRTHVWFVAGYNAGGNRAAICHYIKGEDPKQTIKIIDLGPSNVNMSARSPKFKTINGQVGYEIYAYGSNITYGGLLFIPVDSNYNPIPNAQLIYPDKGLENEEVDTMLYKTFIPLVQK